VWIICKARTCPHFSMARHGPPVKAAAPQGSSHLAKTEKSGVPEGGTHKEAHQRGQSDRLEMLAVPAAWPALPAPLKNTVLASVRSSRISKAFKNVRVLAPGGQMRVTRTELEFAHSRRKQSAKMGYFFVPIFRGQIPMAPSALAPEFRNGRKVRPPRRVRQRDNSGGFFFCHADAILQALLRALQKGYLEFWRPLDPESKTLMDSTA
jgi:hypothetical protein